MVVISPRSYIYIYMENFILFIYGLWLKWYYIYCIYIVDVKLSLDSFVYFFSADFEISYLMILPLLISHYGEDKV